jgi:hypothetical protein
VNLLECVLLHSSGQGVAHALIGAGALAVHGVSRSTFDHDLLVVDRRVLDAHIWHALRAGANIDVPLGDGQDPLAGVVRIAADAERDGSTSATSSLRRTER